MNVSMSSAYSDVFVAIAAVDLAPVVQFYETVFACEPTVQGDRYAEFQLGTLRLGLFKPATTNEAEFPTRTSSLSLCVEVDDLDSFIKRLRSLDIPVPGSMTTASHGREIYIYDPLGDRLILHEQTKVGHN